MGRFTTTTPMTSDIEDIDCAWSVKHIKACTTVKGHINTSNKQLMQSLAYLIDSGASVHCINDKSMFMTIYDNHPTVTVTVANGTTLQVELVGSVNITMISTRNVRMNVTLHNVLYHPSFTHNLISVSRLWKDNKIDTHFGGKCIFMDRINNHKFEFDHRGNSYHTRVCRVEMDHQLLHSRFGHCSERRLNLMRDRCVNFPMSNHEKIHHDPSTCDACQRGGMKRKPYGKRPRGHYTYFGEKLSSDLCFFPDSIQGYKYLLCIVDAYSNWLVTYPLRTKNSDEVKECMEKYLKYMAPFLPKDKPVTWHADNGGEFTSSDLQDFCEEMYVRRSFAIPYSSPTNAHAERMWGILLRTTRIILAQSGVHESFWPYAVSHATRLHNYLPSSKLPNEKSPYEALMKVPPDVSKLRVWGCLCWYHLPKIDRISKLSPRSVPAIHLGIDPQRSGYIVYVPYLSRITSTRDINFQEKRFMIFNDDGIASMPHAIKPLKDTEYQYSEETDYPNQPKPRTPSDYTSLPGDPQTSHNPTPITTNDDNQTDQTDQDDTRAGQTVKGKNPPRSSRTGPFANVTYAPEDVSERCMPVNDKDIVSDIIIPRSYEEAMKSRYAHRWKEAMDIEMKSLLEHNTWELIDKSNVPSNKNIAKSKWCYTVKYNRDGSIERFKARFVVCGYSQVQGQDYTEAFSATLRATSFRMLMAIAAGEKLRLEHFDVKNAFTQANIDADIYVTAARGYESIGRDKVKQVLKLVKSLYGTKQASRLWQLELRKFLVEVLGFTNCMADPCLFIKRDGDKVMIIGVYVDDIILAHKNIDLNEDFIKVFCGPKGFNSKHLGKLNWFLSIGVDQHDDYSIHLSQKLYIDKLTNKFCPDHKNRPVVHSPCQPHTFQKLRPATSDIEREKASQLPYLELIGSLLYLSTMTRPDVAYHLSILCSFMHDPTVEAYSAAIHLLLYIYHTSHAQLTFSGACACPKGIKPELHDRVMSSSGLVVYSDASWHNPDKLGYNMFGYAVFLFGGLISFAAKRIKVVATSSAEAEYAAAAYTCKEIVFVRNLCDFFGIKVDGPTLLCVDNQAAIAVAENLGVTGRNKHFTDSIHYFRHLVDHKVVIPTFVTTHYQKADGFTKALGPTLFHTWRDCIIYIPK